jgi:AmmeMemoRadiSam system protein B
MSTALRAAVVLSVLASGLAVAEEEPARPPSRQDMERMMGLPSQGDRIRGVRDTVGFVISAEQADAVIGLAVQAEAASLREQDQRLGSSAEAGFLGGVCPHDDHLYASRVYVHLTQRITAPRVLLVGVFHRARYWDLENRLVFDAFESWHGPWKPVPVDPLREELVKALPPDSVVVDNAMHGLEHSLEAIVPFLQYRNRDVSIVPILAPYMNWEQLSRLSDELADALAAIMERRDWVLGRDLAIVVSSDAVHYGEDFDHAPFGVDAQAYLRALEREHELVERHLAGTLEPSRLRGLLYELVDESDVRRYRLPWCGRFSVPFGLELLRKTAQRNGLPVPRGHLLRYGTSLSEPEPAVTDTVRQAGLGYTAPSNFHHWVGYAALGYLAPVE